MAVKFFYEIGKEWERCRYTELDFVLQNYTINFKKFFNL